MTVERNRCDFCGEVKDVSRQYLHAARPRKFEETGCDPHTMTRYCNDCGLKEIIVKEAPMTASNPCCEHCEKRVRDRGYIGKGQSRQYLVGVHLECKNPTCSCHPAALKPQPAKEWWEEELKINMGDSDLYYPLLKFFKKVTARIAAQSEKKGREGVVDYIAVRLTQRAETPTNLYDIEVGKVKALYLSEALRIVEAARSSEEGKTV